MGYSRESRRTAKKDDKFLMTLELNGSEIGEGTVKLSGPASRKIEDALFDFIEEHWGKTGMRRKAQ